MKGGGGEGPRDITLADVLNCWAKSLYAASQIQAASTGPSSGDLLGASTTDLTLTAASDNSGPFDSIIAIGVLIKGDTVHFEHIAESVSRGLMRVQLDFGVRASMSFEDELPTDVLTLLGSCDLRLTRNLPSLSD